MSFKKRPPVACAKNMYNIATHMKLNKHDTPITAPRPASATSRPHCGTGPALLLRTLLLLVMLTGALPSATLHAQTDQMVVPAGEIDLTGRTGYWIRNNAGKQIVASLARQLQQEYGNNFSEKNLRRMMQFAVRFPDKEKVVSLIRQLTWTHVIALIPIEDDLKRDCKSNRKG